MKTIRFRQIRHHWQIYFLILPAILLIALFSYFPAISGIYHSFFRWNGDDISEYVGLKNFRDALNDPELAKAFGVVMIFIAANLVKMIPSIVVAVVIHRLVSAKARYIYRIMFVIPMIIPMMVWLLIWKFFYDPNVGILNAILNGTGLMKVLAWLDTAMPAMAASIDRPISIFFKLTFRDLINHPFGSVWGFALTGMLILLFSRGIQTLWKNFLVWLLIIPGALFLFGPMRMVVIIPSAAALAWCLGRSRLFGQDIIRYVGGGIIALSVAIVLLTMTWTNAVGAFTTSNPAWLANEKLVLPALLFWGFPWVGIVGVLLYLSGLGNIDKSVYEAADIDGCGWFRKFWNIELPLITTQVRLNMVLMIINTLKGWGLVYIICGINGGPGGRVMLPGLYMFGKAFRDMEAGYACAIGLLLFFLILVLTLINNKYVRVDK